ncbi:MAG TPA: lysylphosphatidylglycerol synthase transmembrane domain-containing protein [Longimicrobiaceae bacterium]|nr:lysylphosphatidylglycerol synthase transmembrane domain-containing protein [Longimicrobiaceae bacterium]
MRAYSKTIVGLILSVLLLAWALRDVSLAEVASELGQADLLLLTAATVITILGMAIRAVRWGVLLIPAAPGIPFRPRFASTVIGFAANNILPARIGELARAYALGHLTRATVGAALAALVVERILDGIVLVALLFGAMATPGFPDTGPIAGVDPQRAAAVVAFLMGGAGLVLFALVIAPKMSLRVGAMVTSPLPDRFADPIMRGIGSFLSGLESLRSGRIFLASVLLAAGQWIFLALSFQLAFRAFGIYQVPFVGGVFLQSLISLAVAIPSSPGFFGPFEAAATVGLALWEVTPEKAVSFAVGFHLAGFIPITLMGFYYVWRFGMKWSDVRRVEEKIDDEQPLPNV